MMRYDVNTDGSVTCGYSLFSREWWLAAISLCHRELVRFFRQKSRVIGGLGTPLFFWILIGSGLHSSFRPPGEGYLPSQEANAGYLTYFFPGSIAMILLFTSIFTNISLIQDRNEGFLQSVLVAPVSRASLVMGKVLGGATVALLQGIVFLAFAPFAGFHVTIMTFIFSVISMFITALTLSALGFLFAWKVNSVQGFHGIMNLVLLPMWLLSGAFFPQSGAVSWMRFVMAANPLTYGVSALRESFNMANGMLLTFASHISIMALFGLAAFLLCVWSINRGTKEI